MVFKTDFKAYYKHNSSIVTWTNPVYHYDACIMLSYGHTLLAWYRGSGQVTVITMLTTRNEITLYNPTSFSTEIFCIWMQTSSLNASRGVIIDRFYSAI